MKTCFQMAGCRLSYAKITILSYSTNSFPRLKKWFFVLSKKVSTVQQEDGQFRKVFPAMNCSFVPNKLQFYAEKTFQNCRTNFTQERNDSPIAGLFLYAYLWMF